MTRLRQFARKATYVAFYRIRCQTANLNMKHWSVMYCMSFVFDSISAYFAYTLLFLSKSPTHPLVLYKTNIRDVDVKTFGLLFAEWERKTIV